MMKNLFTNINIVQITQLFKHKQIINKSHDKFLSPPQQIPYDEL